MRNEYEKNKLQSKVIELTNELEVTKEELTQINLKYNTLVAQNSKLMEQLRIFERESYEIQAKIKRGFEVERENENISKTVDNIRERERELLRQVEDLKQVIKLKENEIDRFKG